MREHGVLNRLLLVYDHFVVMLTLDQSINPQWVSDSAGIIRTFIEEYHEKLEEDYLFRRFEKKGKLTDLVKVLRVQHEQGRVVMDNILQLQKQPTTNPDDKKK